MPVHTVNLLPKEGFEYTPLGKILTWTLSIGRVIVIFTELIVITAFLYRLLLDRRLTDLLEQNQSKRLQVEAHAQTEEQFRLAQEKLAVYKELASLPKKSDRVRKIAQALPAGVILSKISIQEKGFLASGESLSESSLAGLVTALDKTDDFTNIKISNVRLDNESGQVKIKFDLTGEIK